MKKFIIQSIILLIAGLGVACEKPVWTLGAYALTLPSGEIIYFRRQAAGLNVDRLSVTKESNVCKSADESTDIIFRELGPTLYYHFIKDELHIYSYESPKVPTSFMGSTRIIFHVISNTNDIEEKYRSKELKIIDVSLAETVCP